VKRLAAVFLMLFLPFVALGQGVPLVVDGAKTVQVERQVIVKVDVLTVSAFPFAVTASAGQGAIYFWSYPPGVVAVDQGERLEVKSAPKGELLISVKALVVDWDQKKFTTRLGSVTVVVGESGVTPPVPPDPIKPPAPLAKAWVVVIEETADATAKRGAYFRDPALTAFVQAKGWKVRVADKDVRDAAGQQPADLAPYLKAAQGKTLPWLFVVGSDGAVAFQGGLPPTPAELVALLRKLGG
jgi:hypothetical protein